MSNTIAPSHPTTDAVVGWAARAQKQELAVVLAAIESRLAKIEEVEQSVRRREVAADLAATELLTARLAVGDVVRLEFRSGKFAGRSGTVLGFVRGNPQLVHVQTEVGVKYRVPTDKVSRLVPASRA